MRPQDVQLDQVYFEIYKRGRAIRVSAIDPITNTEIVMVGAPGYGNRMLKRLAICKLKYVIARNASKAETGTK